MNNQKRSVALDCDGVIIDSISYHVIAWKKAFRDLLHLNLTAWIIRHHEGVRGLEFIDRITRKHGLSLTPEKIESVYQYKRQVYHSVFRLSPIPGSLSLIKTLFDFSYHLALVTSTDPEEAKGALEKMGVINKFSVIITHDDITHGKPSPEPYLLAARRLDSPPTIV